MTERRDPVLGEAPDLSERDDGPLRGPRRGGPKGPKRRQRRAIWIGIGVALVVAAFVLVHWRGAIGARLVPPPQQNSVMQQADRALQAGRLTSPDGRGARELYQAALARDPDDLVAREGLVRVGSAALAQAQQAIAGGRIDEARRDLDLARDLSVPTADITPVEDALRKAGGGEGQLARLLASADTAERAGHLDDGDASALSLYQQILAQAPDNTIALARRRALLARMLGGLDGLLAQGDVDGARRLVDRVAAVDPGHLDLPAARARLSDATEQQTRAAAHLLDGADASLRAGRIDEAVAVYRQVLAQDAGNLRAHTGLRAAGETLVREANRAASDFDFAGADAALAKARALAPELPSLHAAEKHMQQARMIRSGMGPKTGGTTNIDDLLAAADRAIARDELVDPPGDSAFDKLHAAAALAPADPRVVAANHHFVATVADCVRHAMTDNRLARASGCLDALSTIQPTYASLPSLRTSLAGHWLAYADERIGAGEIDTALHAIDSAQRFNPDDPAIAALRTRAKQARAGSKH